MSGLKVHYECSVLLWPNLKVWFTPRPKGSKNIANIAVMLAKNGLIFRGVRKKNIMGGH